MTKREFFVEQAPAFNFELNEDQLIDKAIESGFIVKVGDDNYQYEEHYIQS